jgi:hypothetical protein
LFDELRECQNDVYNILIKSQECIK